MVTSLQIFNTYIYIIRKLRITPVRTASSLQCDLDSILCYILCETGQKEQINQCYLLPPKNNHSYRTATGG
jgi:hypothetical protein